MCKINSHVSTDVEITCELTISLPQIRKNKDLSDVNSRLINHTKLLPYEWNSYRMKWYHIEQLLVIPSLSLEVNNAVKIQLVMSLRNTILEKCHV